MKPLADDLETLRAEADGPAPGADTTSSSASSSSDNTSSSAPDDETVFALAMAARSVGNVICRRYHVDPLGDEESQAIGRALAKIAAAYNLGNLDPKAAAWLGLGMTALFIAAPRMEQAARTIEATATEVPPPPASATPPAAPAEPAKPDTPYGQT